MSFIYLVIAMAVVTFVPRLLPVFITERVVFKGWANKWLKAIPYAAIGALIFPGILRVQEGQPWIGLTGGLVAVLLSYFKFHIIIVILGSIFAIILLSAGTNL